ncbi:MAG: hypothetical protein ACREU6_14680, partial [Steroidobacteraceae bacterium]
DEMLHVAQAAGLLAEHRWTIATAKFLQPVRPGETLTLEYELLANGSMRFAIRNTGRLVAGGTLVPRPVANESYDGHQTR